MFKRLLNQLIYGGDKKLREYEAFVLSELYRNLNAANKHKFIKQVSCLDKVQRWKDGKVSAFFDNDDEMKENWDADIAFYNLETKRDIVAKVEFKIDSEVIKASIEFYKGYLLYIHFNNYMDLKNKEFKKAQIGFNSSLFDHEFKQCNLLKFKLLA